MTFTVYNADLDNGFTATIYWDKHAAGQLVAEIRQPMPGTSGFVEEVQRYTTVNDDGARSRLVRKIKAWAKDHNLSVFNEEYRP